MILLINFEKTIKHNPNEKIDLYFGCFCDCLV